MDRPCHSGYIVHGRRFDATCQAVWPYILEAAQSIWAMPVNATTIQSAMRGATESDGGYSVM
jgi:hypothetical protein